jgi:predicted outer membrane protein
MCVGVAALTLAACNGDGGKSDSAGDAAGTLRADGQPSYGGANDSHVLFVFNEALRHDSALAQLALSRVQGKNLRDLAQKVATNAHSFRERAAQVATEAGIVPVPQPNDLAPARHREQLEKFQAMAAGASWDAAYIDQVVASRQDFLDVLNRMSGIVQRPTMKALVQDASAATRGNLDQALALQAARK